MTSQRPPVNVLYPKCVITNNFRTKKYKNMKLGILDNFRLLNLMETTIFQNIHKNASIVTSLYPRGPIYNQNGPTPITLEQTNTKT